MQARSTPRSKADTVAITGATGFVGSTLIKLLASQGWRIRALARSPSKIIQFANYPIDWVFGDLSNSDCLKSLVYNTHAVIHCAGTVRGSHLSYFIAGNVDGVSNLVTAISASSSQPRLLLVSSLAARMPDISDYAKSKSQGEELLTAQTTKLNWTILRPAAIYGEADQEMKPLLDLMQKGICLQLSESSSRFSLIHVDDVAQAVQQWLSNGVAEHETVELDDGRPNGYGWQDIIDIASTVFHRPVRRIYIPAVILKTLAIVSSLVAKILQNSPMLTPGKARELAWHDWVCDTQGQAKIANWQPIFQLEQGLKRIYCDNESKT